MAPSRKERGKVCGAYKAGVLLIRAVYSAPERQPVKKRDEQRQEQRQQKVAEIEDEFRTVFLANFGILDCAEIKKGREKGRTGMDDVVGATARLLERMLDKERP